MMRMGGDPCGRLSGFPVISSALQQVNFYYLMFSSRLSGFPVTSSTLQQPCRD